MRLDTASRTIVVRAPAKVNLFLEVLGKRPDGYHEIATLMLAIRLMDTLVFKEESALKLECDSPDLSTGPDNLILRAARALKQRTGSMRGAHIRLKKRIPVAAGLGGGSSDAAATLWALNRLWQLNLPPSELELMGSELGSDIPFFFHAPAAWCTGRGEKVTPLKPGRIFDLVLLCPGLGCPTSEVYKKVAVPPAPQNGALLRRAVEEGTIDEIGRCLFNRLEAAAESVVPALAGYQRRLADLAPAGQLMSGSGSSFFALCRHQSEARRIADELRHGAGRDLFQVFPVRSCLSQLKSERGT